MPSKMRDTSSTVFLIVIPGEWAVQPPKTLWRGHASSTNQPRLGKPVKMPVCWIGLKIERLPIGKRWKLAGKEKICLLVYSSVWVRIEYETVSILPIKFTSLGWVAGPRHYPVIFMEANRKPSCCRIVHCCHGCQRFWSAVKTSNERDSIQRLFLFSYPFLQWPCL